jgi:hypothetical protein
VPHGFGAGAGLAGTAGFENIAYSFG